MLLNSSRPHGVTFQKILLTVGIPMKPQVLFSKVKSVPLQAWSGPEGPMKLRFPDFMRTAQGGG